MLVKLAQTFSITIVFSPGGKTLPETCPTAVGGGSHSSISCPHLAFLSYLRSMGRATIQETLVVIGYRHRPNETDLEDSRMCLLPSRPPHQESPSIIRVIAEGAEGTWTPSE